MKFILGKKLKMMQVFADSGESMPVTLIAADPCTVVQVKTVSNDGYDALQIGTGSKKKASKPLAGHQKGLANFAWLREYRPRGAEDLSKFKRGDIVDVSIFKEGDKVTVSGVTKGKGFQGVVKRHGFHGGPASHGQKHSAREPGAIGGGARAAGRVAKGMRMAGRMGGERMTTSNLKIVKIDAKNNIIAVKGAVPGGFGTRLEVYGK